MNPRLPRGVTALLRRLLPGDLADPIAGDLLEDYRRARARQGGVWAGFWIWMQAIRLAAAFRWERLAHGRGVPPIAEELRSVMSRWDALRQDLVFSLRMLRRQPGFTVVALFALALGIGASTTIFSIVDAVLWRPLPYPGADRVMQLAEQRPRESRWFGPVAPADYFDWQRDNRSFSSFAAYSRPSPSRTTNLTGNGEPERVQSLEVAPAFLSVLGIAPAFGRDFRAEEETVGRHRVALLSDGLWRRRFAADPSVIGRTIAFDGNPFEIVGVLPSRFWWPSHPDVLVPLALDDHDRTLRAAHFLDVIGRLRDDVSLAQAREDLRIIGVRLSEAYPAENARHAPNLRPLRDALVGDMRPALLVLLGAVAFVMLIACANVATLLLARAAGRQKELSVRRAVGATRSRLVQQMLTESLVVAFAGGAAGLLVAAWGLAAFRTIAPAQFAGLPGLAGVGIDARILLAAFALSGLTGIVFGVLPALVASDDRIGVGLTEEARGSSGSVRARHLRSALVVAELALSLVLLAGAALLIVSFNRVVNVSPGFQPAQLVTARITLPALRYSQHARTTAFFEALYERLRNGPGVQHVAATTSLPFDGADSRLNLVIEHRTGESPFPVRVHPRIVSTDYFQTLGIPLVRGRGFTEHDADSSGNVVVVNEAAARRYWPNQEPIGQRISIGADDDWREIVGIVGDIRHEGLDADAEPAAFLPQRQGFFNLGNGFERGMTLVIRASGDAASLSSLLRTSVASIDPQLPVGMARPMDDLIDESVAPRRLNFMLVSTFAFVALVLTAAGLYGVMAYVVAQRTREIGVRMALGATRGQVLALMLRQAGTITAVGIGLGLAGALLVTRSMTSLLFGVTATDPFVYLGVSTLLAAVALLAVAVPSSRAAQIDPLLALRDS
jgi:putative ABC transport system permease protein